MKKVLAIALCVIMMLSLCTFVYADEVTTVTVKVMDEIETLNTWTWTSEDAAPTDITLRVDDFLNITVTLANGEQATFFTYAKDAGEFSNENVQFIAQGESGDMIADFKPRDTFIIDEATETAGSIGEFTATISGEGMDVPMKFDYTVTGPEAINAQAVLSSSGEHYGMRFVFKQFHNEKDEIVKYGAYIVPASIFIQGDYSSTVAAMLDEDIDNGETYAADILDIPLENDDTYIIAIPYMQFANETAIGTYVYGAQAMHSVAELIGE